MKSSHNPQKSPFLFDLFGLPSIPIQGALRVKKRDGHIESFSLQKLSESIKKALQSAGIEENELEYSLATAIKTYLRECHGLEAIVTSEEINSLTVQILREMGQLKTMRSYMEFCRQKRLQQKLISKIKNSDVLPKKKTEDTSQELYPAAQQNLDILTQKINQVLEPLDLNKRICKKITQQILEILNQLQYHQPTSYFISELCLLLLNREGIIHNARNPFVNLPVAECIEIMREGSAEDIDPEMTDMSLGKKVKEQISRSLIFSPEIIDAHDTGLIHLHYIERIDRFLSLEQPAYYFWMLNREKLSSLQSPEDFWNLLTDTYYRWTDFFLNPIVWWGFNWAIAPLIKGLEGNDYKNWVFNWIKQCEEVSQEFPGMQVILDWSLPQKWMDSPAFGHKGKNLGAPCSSYETVAQNLMVDTLECIRQKEDCPPYLTDSILWRLNLPLEIDPSSVFWPLLASCVEDREVPISLQFTPREAMDMTSRVELWGVTINLARIAYKNPTKDNFYSAVYEACLLAIQAWEEKLNFLLKYAGETSANLWQSLLDQLYKNPKERLPLTAFPMALNISGVNECIHLLNPGIELKPLELWEQAEGLLKKIRTMLNGCIHGKDLKVQFSLETNVEILKQLAQKDTDEFPDLLPIINTGNPFHFSPYYATEISPLVFYHPEKLTPLFDKLFATASLFDKPLQVSFLPERVWDSLILSEVIQLFGKMNKNFTPIQFRFNPSE